MEEISRRRERAAAIALQAVAYLAADEVLAGRFAAQSGLGPADWRDRIEEREFQSAALGFVLEDDERVLGLAAAAGLAPEEVMGAWAALGGAAGL